MPGLTTKDDLPSYKKDDGRKKIAIIQTGSWGDNVNSTLMLLPIKGKWPNSVIDVYTTTIYGSAFHNNPYIDNLVHYEAYSKHDALHFMNIVPQEIDHIGYDLIFNAHPMINADKWTALKSPLGTNLICAWVRALEDLDIEYTLPLTTILKLTEGEAHKVNEYWKTVPKRPRNVLMETYGESGQTFWNHEWTIKVGQHLLDGKTNLFISRKEKDADCLKLEQHAPGFVHHVGGLSIRECAHLFNKCSHFFSISSGLSNACNTNWCKNDIVWIETTAGDGCTSAPVRKDGKVFWHKNDLKMFMSMLRGLGI